METETESSNRRRQINGVVLALTAEFVGTALLVLIGLSIVIAMFGVGGPGVTIIPNPGIRRLITGFLFGSTGALIAVSWVGKKSGAHINPAVTLGFWILNKMDGTRALGYVLAQLAGAVVGALPLLIWGKIGRSVAYGATLPGNGYGVWTPLLGEVVTTFALVAGLFLFIGRKRLAPWTPLLFPFLYAAMVFLEAPVSGTSTNPARSLGPSVIANVWTGWWIYWIGPALGAIFGAFLQKASFLKKFEIKVAKIYHFEHDPHGIFRSTR